MKKSSLNIITKDGVTFLEFSNKVTLYEIANYEKRLETTTITSKKVQISLNNVTYLDTAGALFLQTIKRELSLKDIEVSFEVQKEEFQKMLQLVKQEKASFSQTKKDSFLVQTGELFYNYYIGFISFLSFIGKLFATKLHYLKSWKNIRYKEIAFEINENGVKAFYIVALTSFLIGLVVAYQSAYQLKMYGANIFVVDMLSISMFRELAPLMTAIVIAGRSGSAFTAQIGAMKITEELDAMKTMGFDPYIFLVMPRIIALMIVLPILIFFADMMGVLGGIFVANLDLKITPQLFIERLNEVVAAKHFLVGLLKGPFFAFLIASIGIYRGLMVKDDTQSIGLNTTKSVVESIFAVIICDAIFSIMFTNLGI